MANPKILLRRLQLADEAWQSTRARAAKAGAGSRPGFVEVVTRTPSTVELELGSGIVLRVAETVDVEALRRMVDVLAGARC